MNADEPAEFEDDDLTSLLAGGDDSLASGKLPADLAARGLDRDLAFLHTLRQTLRIPPTTDGAGVTSTDRVGTQLGRFEIRRELGRGGFGVVYLAYDPLLHREVALKVPRTDAPGNPEWRERFRREARAAAGLTHPHIVPVHEAGEVDSVCYLVSAYCPGITLADWLRQTTQPVPFAEAATLIAALAEAVQHAHEQGVIHRDLKPANILLQRNHETHETHEKKKIEEGLQQSAGKVSSAPAPSDVSFSCVSCVSWFTPKITDFGLAKLLITEDADGPTRSGMILGTATYMAPEQADGRARTVGPEADIWALGAMLYQLLTGRPPFTGDAELVILLQARSQDPVSPARLRRRLPRDLDTICLKCLEKEPRKRYARAADLADDLRRYLDGRPIQARRVRLPERVWRWGRRHPGASAVLGTVAAALLLLTVGSLFAARTFRDERDQTEANLCASYLAQIEAGARSGLSGQHFRSLETLDLALRLQASAARPERMPSALQLRNAALGCLARPDLYLAHFRSQPETNGLLNRVVYDDALEQFAVLHGDKTVRLMSLTDGREQGRMAGPIPSGLHAFRFSPNGQYLTLVESDGVLHLWDVRRQEHWLPAVDRVFHGAVAFRADSTQLAVGHADGTITLYELTDRKSRRLQAAGPGPLTYLAYAPDSRCLATCADASWTVRLRDLFTGDVLRELQHPAAVWLVAWSPDSQRLAAGCDDATLHVWDTATGRASTVLRGHQGRIVAVAFHPAGDRLVSAAWDATLRLWDVVAGEQLFSTRAVVTELSFHADGHRLGSVLHGVDIGVWHVAEGRECRTLTSGGTNREDELNNGAISPDGRLLAVSGNEGVRLWDLLGGRELAFLPVGPIHGVAFGPTDSSLFVAGLRGLSRWPVRPVVEAQTWILGAPETLLPQRAGRLALDRDGRLLATVTHPHDAVLLPLDGAPPRAVKLPHVNVDTVALSPDGKWAATGTWHGPGVKVWDTQQGTSKPELLPEERTTTVFFSPRGRWLLAGTPAAYHLWDVGTWRPGLVLARDRLLGLPGWAAFSADEQLLAVERAPSQIQLLHPETGQEYATLESPDVRRLKWMGFSPDGCRLVVVSDLARVQVWDLHRLRAQLAQRQLDWASPVYTPSTANKPIQAVQVELTAEMLVRRAAHHRRHGQWDRAIADYRVALVANPEYVSACNNLAWMLVTCPAEYRDPEAALPLAQRAVLKRTEHNTLNTLGVVYYRLGEWEQAAVTLRAGIRAGRGRAMAWDLYFLAMSCHRLGDAAQARTYYARALAAQQQVQDAQELAELRGIRVETERVLRMAHDEPPARPMLPD